MKTTDDRLDQIEMHLSGNGKPSKGLLFRVAVIEKVQGSILRWVRFVAGVVVVGVAKLLIFGGG